jgi:formylmethanofuran dehydrogenase subunit C
VVVGPVVAGRGVDARFSGRLVVRGDVDGWIGQLVLGRVELHGL